MDRFSALLVFRRVVERSGFSKAARELGLSNAAVSKAVKDLEAELGAALLVRTTRALGLTDVGLAYYDRVCLVLDGLAEADEWVRSESAEPRGGLKISAPVSFGLTALSRALPLFAARHPALSIDLSLSDAFVDLVESSVDVAIRGGQLEDSSLRARKLTEIPRAVCAAPAYLARQGRPRRPEDLARHHCLVYSGSRSPDVWRLVSGRKQRAVAVSGRYRVDNSLALRDAALAGAGLALLPRAYATAELAAGQLEDALPSWEGEPQALHAVYPAHRERSLKVSLFLDFLQEVFAEP